MPIVSNHHTAWLYISYEIDRDGEQIVLTVRRMDGSPELDTFLASFDWETGRYKVAVKNVGTIGEYIIGLQDNSGRSIDKGVRFRVECASVMRAQGCGALFLCSLRSIGLQHRWCCGRIL